MDTYHIMPIKFIVWFDAIGISHYTHRSVINELVFPVVLSYPKIM